MRCSTMLSDHTARENSFYQTCSADRPLLSTSTVPRSSSFVTSDQSSILTASPWVMPILLLNPGLRSSGTRAGKPAEAESLGSLGRLLRRQWKRAGKVGRHAERMARQTSTTPHTAASTSESRGGQCRLTEVMNGQRRGYRQRLTGCIRQ